METNIKPEREILVPSSDGQKLYTVSVFDTFDECDCDGFRFNRKCRHIEKVRNQLLNT